MSRVKYPNKEEINKEIQKILDESGMFEESEKAQRYTEFVQVKRKPFLRTEIMLPVAAAAAVLFAVVSINTVPGILPESYELSGNSISGSEAMTNVMSDDTIKTASRTAINENIEVEMCTKTRYLVSSVAGEKYENAEIVYNYPIVYYKGEAVDSITEYYEQRFEEIVEQAKEKHRNSNIEINYKNYSEDEMIKIQYNCSAVSGILTEENNILTIYEDYSETIPGYNETTTINRVYGSNFDVENGYRLELEDIFTEEAVNTADMSKVYEFIQEKGREALGTSVDIEQFKEEGSWYFSIDGLTICINNIEGAGSTRHGMVYRSYYSASVVIPYNSLTMLKPEYNPAD